MAARLFLVVLASLHLVLPASARYCFAQTLHGYIFYSSGCLTDTDCVNACDCGAVCVDTLAGCNVSNPDPAAICPYLHAKNGTACRICPSSGVCGICPAPPPPPTPPAPKPQTCSADSSCNVCDACCKSYLHNANDCADCVKKECP